MDGSKPKNVFRGEEAAYREIGTDQRAVERVDMSEG